MKKKIADATVHIWGCPQVRIRRGKSEKNKQAKNKQTNKQKTHTTACKRRNCSLFDDHSRLPPPFRLLERELRELPRVAH